MMRKTKKGITLASLVIYLVLFTIFTVFASGVSSNMNERLFNNRGEAINYSALNKLQYNLEDSAAKSYDINVSTNRISFSNGDDYSYDEESRVIYKNSGILCLNVESFSPVLESTTNSKKLTLDITFNKYLNVISKKIITCVEGV